MNRRTFTVRRCDGDGDDAHGLRGRAPETGVGWNRLDGQRPTGDVGGDANKTFTLDGRSGLRARFELVERRRCGTHQVIVGLEAGEGVEASRNAAGDQRQSDGNDRDGEGRLKEEEPLPVGPQFGWLRHPQQFGTEGPCR